MDRVLHADLRNHVGEEVMIRGFMHVLRDKGKIGFLVMRDRSGLTQVILDQDEQLRLFDGIYAGSTLEIVGTVYDAPNTKYWVELKDATLTLLRWVTHVHGVDIWKDELKVDFDTLFDERTVTLRHPSQSAIFKIAASVEKHIRAFFDSNDFTQINTPKIIWEATEWGAEVFHIEYFGKPAFLAQSPQFYKQMMVGVYERVYEIGKAYRAEPSMTSRHMSEILMVDMEMWFINGIEDIRNMTEWLMYHVIDAVWSECETELTTLWATKPLMSPKIPVIKMKDIQKMYSEATWEDTTNEIDMTPAEERWICEYAAKELWSDFVFVCEFPWEVSGFYHYRRPDEPHTTDRADLLFRWVEVATVPRRQADYELLKWQMEDKWIDHTAAWFQHYLDAFKYGLPEHGGFWFGLSRFVQKIIWLDNVKKAELFPRDVNRLTP